MDLSMIAISIQKDRVQLKEVISYIKRGVVGWRFQKRKRYKGREGQGRAA
jgi:hypothetical protein